MDPRAQVFVGQPDHDRLGHRRVGEQRRFHLGRIDVLPARQNQVGAPVGDVEIAVSVHPAEIAKALEAVGQPPFLRSDIAVARLPGVRADPAHENLAHFARRQGFAIFAADQNLAARGPADRAAMGEPFDAIELRRREALGAAVHLPDAFRPQPVDPELLERRRDRRGGVPDGLQRGHVARLAFRRGQPGDALHHRRHQVDPFDPMPLDQREEFRSIEPGHAHHRKPVQHGHMSHGEREVVIERRRVEHDAIRPHAKARRSVRHAARMMIDDQLGPPGRSARGHRLPARRLQAGERRHVGMIASERHRQRAQRRPQRRIGGHHRARLRQLDDRAQLGRRQPRRDDRGRRPQLPHRIGQLVKLVRIGQGQHHPVALPDAEPGQSMRPAQRPLRQFLPAKHILAVPHRPALRPEPRRVSLRHIAEQHIHRRSPLRSPARART